MNYFSKDWRISQCCQFFDKQKAKKWNPGTTTKTYALKPGGKEKVQNKALENCDKLISVLEDYFSKQPVNLRSFRISSELFPCYTLDFTKDWYEEIMPKIKEKLNKAGKIAKQNNIRLSTHPGQFTVLGSNKANVVQNSIKDLEYHSLYGKLMGLPAKDFTMNIHLQGLYNGTRKAGIDRFATNFTYLSDYAQQCLAVENEDKHKSGYDIVHVLELCERIPTRATLDIHHYECFRQKINSRITSNNEEFRLAVKTWKDCRPLFHVSQTILNADGSEGRMNAHSETLYDKERLQDLVPMLEYADFDIEAKNKEIAVQDAYAFILEEQNFAGEQLKTKN